MRVLITSPRGKENLVRAFEQAGATIVASLLELPDLIIPTVDEELPFFAANKEWFLAQGIEVMVGSPYTIEHCRDKAEFNLWCQRHGFLTPRTYQRQEVLKPRFGKGGKGIIKVQASDYVYQEDMSQWPEVSIDYFCELRGQEVSIVPRYRLNVINGESHDMEIVPNFDIEKITRFGEEMGLVGHNVIQGWMCEEVFMFSEVNPRFGGGSHLTFDIFNSPKALLENLKCMSMKALSITLPHS